MSVYMYALHLFGNEEFEFPVLILMFAMGLTAVTYLANSALEVILGLVVEFFIYTVAFWHYLLRFGPPEIVLYFGCFSVISAIECVNKSSCIAEHTLMYRLEKVDKRNRESIMLSPDGILIIDT